MERKILIAKEDCKPLFRKGDEFVVVGRNTEPEMMPIVAMRLRDKQIYGFDEGELEEAKN